MVCAAKKKKVGLPECDPQANELQFKSTVEAVLGTGFHLWPVQQVVGFYCQ